jgi:protein-disulfide isomerase
VRVTFTHNALAFHKDARPAAIATMAAHRQGKFWEMHDKCFANQRALQPADLEKYATEIGLDIAQFKKDLADPAIAAKVDLDQRIAVAVGATGTPAFFINGQNLKGAQPFERFEAVVKAELEAAKGQRGLDYVKTRTKANNAALASYLYEGKMPPAQAAPRADTAAPQPVDRTVYKVQVDVAKDAVKGNAKEALVTLVEFSDFQCPFCSRLNPAIDKVLETYGDKVRVIFKHNPLPFHKEAFPAAEAALCAGEQGKFWEMHDKLFANMRALQPENLEAYAKESGVGNLGKWKQCATSGKYKAQIESDQELAGKVTARGTPNTFVNGRKLTGAKPFEEFKTLIDEELKKAEALVAKGIPKAKVYEEIIKDGKVFEPLDEQVNDFAIDGNANVLGNPKAKIQIVEFSDFQCPFCSRVGEPLKEVAKHYGKDIAIVFKNFPLSFHKEAMPAAQAALCAKKEGKFWEMHDHLFANQKSLKDLTTDGFAEWAKTVGVKDIDAFKKCVDSGETKAQVDADMAEARKAGVRGTPTLYINGRKFTSPSGYNLAAFTGVIDKYILKK